MLNFCTESTFKYSVRASLQDSKKLNKLENSYSALKLYQ